MRSILRVIMPTILALLITTSLVESKAKEQISRDCGNGKRETWTLFEDDCDGSIYTLYVDCDGKQHWNVPRPNWLVIGSSGGVSVVYPPDFWQMLEQADFTTPGADVAWVGNEKTGERVFFRNPIDQIEEQKIIDAWICSTQFN